MTVVPLKKGSLVLYTFPGLAAAGAYNVVATRLGGSSTGPYAALNVGFSVGDDPAVVQANRRALYEAAEVHPSAVVTCRQVHSAHVARVTRDDGGRGALASGDVLPQADGLITDEPGLFLFLRFADCVPVLLCDPVHGAVGLAHAGWKGTLANIVGNTVALMSSAFGSRPADLLAAIGPAIGPCHYTVRGDVARQVRESLPFWEHVLRPIDAAWTLDLPEANRRLLLGAGLVESHMTVSGLCTACHRHQFYSHRAEGGRTGRFGVLIAWKGQGLNRD